MNYEIQSFEILGQIWQKLQGFPYWRNEKELPPTSQKFANSPSHQEKCSICSICTECCFQFWKRFQFSEILLVRLPPPNRKRPLQNVPLPQLERCPYSLIPFQKPWIAHLHQQRIFWGNWLNINITFVYQLFSIMPKCFIKFF